MRAMAVMTGLAATLALGGCAETKFLDAVGAGKYVPDETQVHQNTALSMPPDLQLRPPVNGGGDELAPNVPRVPVAAMATPPAGSIPAAPAAMTTAPVVTAQAPAAAPSQSQDPYARYGVSRIGPDGKPKSQAQLDEELRQAVLAEKRKTNPNYGTVFNIGSLFSGW